MKLRRSKTFPGTQKPEIDGVYERNYVLYDGPDDWNFCMFRNGLWMQERKSVEKARREKNDSFYQSLPWRGLATKDGK